MQSEVADFALSAATWRTGRDICVVFDPGSFALLCKTCRRLQNRKYI